jgi:hypothetical protein
MENIISKYKDGNDFARENLIGNIMETYNYSLTRDEAIMLLHKKYGKPEIF